MNFPVWSCFPHLDMCVELVSAVADIGGLSHALFMTNSGIIWIDWLLMLLVVLKACSELQS